MNVKKIVKKIQRDFGNKQFVVFMVIGAMNTLGGSLYATVISYVMQENIAFVFGYVLALLLAYLLNSKFTFQKKMTWEGLFKFAISYIPNFVIQNIVVVLLFNVLGIPSVFAFFTAAIIGIPVTFLLLKYYAFRQK